MKIPYSIWLVIVLFLGCKGESTPSDLGEERESWDILFEELEIGPEHQINTINDVIENTLMVLDGLDELLAETTLEEDKILLQGLISDQRAKLEEWIRERDRLLAAKEEMD